MAVEPRRLLLVLYRHAESENNAIGDHDSGDVTDAAAKARQPDPPLTSRGEQQASCAAQWFAQRWASRVKHIYVSPMKRALQTAAPLCELMDVPTAINTSIFECGGCFFGSRAEQSVGRPNTHGLTLAQVHELLPRASADEAAFSAEREGGWWRGGFETPDESRARAADVQEWLWSQVASVARAPSEPVAAIVLVCHGLFMSTLVQELLGMSTRDAAHVSRPGRTAVLTCNCALAVLELRLEDGDNRAVGLLRANWDEHLPQSLRTGHTVDGFELLPDLLL